MKGEKLRKEEKKVFRNERGTEKEETEEEARIRRRGNGKREAIVHFQPDPSSPDGRTIRTSVSSGLVREKNLPNLPSPSQSSSSQSFAVTMDGEQGPRGARSRILDTEFEPS